MPYQEDYAFASAGIPVLYPSSVTEFRSFGLHAIRLSRCSGCWAALKLVSALCDGGESVTFEDGDVDVRLPDYDRLWHQAASSDAETRRLLAVRLGELVDYQSERYAREYLDTVTAIGRREQEVAPGSHDLTRAVARNLYKLMAYKDEYEVARLFLVTWYRQLIDDIHSELRNGNQAVAVTLADLPDRIRGYEQVKRQSAEAARAEAAVLREQLRRPMLPISVA
jgi:hypothetical protein